MDRKNSSFLLLFILSTVVCVIPSLESEAQGIPYTRLRKNTKIELEIESADGSKKTYCVERKGGAPPVTEDGFFVPYKESDFNAFCAAAAANPSWTVTCTVGKCESEPPEPPGGGGGEAGCCYGGYVCNNGNMCCTGGGCPSWACQKCGGSYYYDRPHNKWTCAHPRPGCNYGGTCGGCGAPTCKMCGGGGGEGGGAATCTGSCVGKCPNGWSPCPNNDSMCCLGGRPCESTRVDCSQCGYDGGGTGTCFNILSGYPVEAGQTQEEACDQAGGQLEGGVCKEYHGSCYQNYACFCCN